MQGPLITIMSTERDSHSREIGTVCEKQLLSSLRRAFLGNAAIRLYGHTCRQKCSHMKVVACKAPMGRTTQRKGVETDHGNIVRDGGGICSG
jgi:hypothetical protein